MSKTTPAKSAAAAAPATPPKAAAAAPAKAAAAAPAKGAAAPKAAAPAAAPAASPKAEPKKPAAAAASGAAAGAAAPKAAAKPPAKAAVAKPVAEAEPEPAAEAEGAEAEGGDSTFGEGEDGELVGLGHGEAEAGDDDAAAGAEEGGAVGDDAEGEAPTEGDDAEGEGEGDDEAAEVDYDFGDAPEGFTYREAVIDAYKAAAKKHKLSGEVAKDVLDTMLPAIQADAETQFAEHREAKTQEWKAELQQRHGKKLRAVLALANRGINAVASPGLKDFYRESALAWHPEHVEAWAFVGQRLTNDRSVKPAGRSATEKERTAVEEAAEEYERDAKKRGE